MVHPAVGGGGHASAGTVARAVVRVAQEGAALLDVGVPRVGVARVRCSRRPLGVHDHDAGAAGPHALLVEVRLELVRRPLPHVAAHVVEPKGIRRVAPHRRGDPMAVRERVLEGEPALPDVGAVDAPGDELRPPRVALAVRASARRPLPLRLRGEPLARPLRVGRGVEPGDVDHGVGLHPIDGAAGALGVTPVGPRGPHPPLGVVAEIHGPRGLGEDQRAGHEGARRRLGRPRRELGREFLPAGDDLRGRAVPRGLDEARELRVGDLGLVDPEAVHPHPMGGALVGAALLAVPAHGELTRLDPHHAGGNLGRRLLGGRCGGLILGESG